MQCHPMRIAKAEPLIFRPLTEATSLLCVITEGVTSLETWTMGREGGKCEQQKSHVTQVTDV